MLPVVMFMGFHDADTGDAHGVEGTVVTAASETIKAVDHHNIEISEILIALGFHISGKIARGAIHFAARETAVASFFGGFIGARAFGEDPDRGIIRHPVNARDIGNHVIVQNAFNFPAFIQRMFRDYLPAK